MRIAVPIFGSRISPVLDTASRLLVVDVKDGAEVSRREEVIQYSSLSRRRDRLRELGVEVVVCGAITGELAAMLASAGVKVIPWMAGEAGTVLRAYLTDGLPNERFLMPGCCRIRTRRRFRGGQGDHRRGHRKEIKMKIAITSQGRELSSPVDPRFGRAKKLIIYDTETGSYEAVDNAQNLNAVRGAGIQTAENVARHNVEFVLTGHCGPKAFVALRAADIKVIIGVEGTVETAIERFKTGELKPAEEADVEGHWI